MVYVLLGRHYQGQNDRIMMKRSTISFDPFERAVLARATVDIQVVKLTDVLLPVRLAASGRMLHRHILPSGSPSS